MKAANHIHKPGSTINNNAPQAADSPSGLTANNGAPEAFAAKELKILIVEDEPAAHDLLKKVIEDLGYLTETAETFPEADRLVKGNSFELILVDIYLGEDRGTRVLEIAAKYQPDTPVVMITGDPSVATAADAIRLGAYDYLCKPVPIKSIRQVVKRAVELRQLRREKKRVELENRQYRENLLALVKEKTVQLEQSEKRYRTLFEYSRDTMYVTDEKGVFLYLNRAAIDLLMYSKEELMRISLGSLFEEPAEGDRFQKMLRESGTVTDFSAQLRKKDATVIECLLTARTIRNNQGEVAESVGIIRDITPNKRAADKIRKQEEFLKYVLDSLPDPFLVVDTNSYKVNMANIAARTKGSPSSKTCYGMTHDLPRPCLLEGHFCVLEEIKKTKQPSIVEHIHYDNDGKARSFEINGFPIFDSNGQLVQIIVYARDITKRKRLESIAEATNLMKNIGYIFSGIRHEIGNPINSIKMTLDVLNKNFETYSLETTRDFLTGALSEVTRVEYLLKALRNFSLFENPELQSVDLKIFIHEFLPIANDDFKKKGIRIETTLASDAGCGYIDPRALHQVMLNLLANAADALQDAQNPQINISLSKRSGTLYLTIEDNGCGMSHEEQANLFKPFHTSKACGTGLGLVIVRRMLSKMDCSISVKSQNRIGTKVTIAIPEAQDAES